MFISIDAFDWISPIIDSAALYPIFSAEIPLSPIIVFPSIVSFDSDHKVIPTPDENESFESIFIDALKLFSIIFLIEECLMQYVLVNLIYLLSPLYL
jgi:hypothetical protein